MQRERSGKPALYGSKLLGRRAVLKALIGLGGACAAGRFLPGTSAFAATADLNAQTVHYPSGEFQIESYFVKPKSAGKYPAILVVHDDTGLDEFVREATRRFASAGFAALAPDLLSRVGGMAKMKSAEETQNAITHLSVEQSVQDMVKGVSFLKTDVEIIHDKISSVGFGWGGGRNFLLAGGADDLKGAVVFGGATPSDGLDDIEAPILAHYAQFDFRVTGNAMWTANTFKALGKRFTYDVYPNVSRHFFNETSPEYDAEAAKLAWTRTLEFLRSPA